MKGTDLKNSILQMAVQGKLVSQDPNDEPASVLLERIRERRRQLIAEGKIKAPKGGESVIYRASDGKHYEKRIDTKGRESDPICIEEEIPFEIPDNWEWSRLGSLCLKIGSGSTPAGGRAVYTTIGSILIRSQNVYDDGLRLDDVAHFSHETYSKRSSHVKARDILLNITGASIGRCAIVPDPFVEADVNQHVLILRLIDYSLQEFLHLAMTSPVVQDAIMGQQVGATKEGLSASKASNLLIPLPTLNEQKLICDRVGEIVGYISQYDALETAREELDAELPNRLRKSILQMAVQGKLVPQDANDESASALLERIRERRRHLMAEGKIKAPKGGESVIYRGSDGGYYEKRIDAKGCESEPVCINDEIPFEIPDSWEWSRLQTILSLNSGLGYKKADLNTKSTRMIRILRGGNISANDELSLQDSDVFIANQFVEEELQLYPGQIITPAVTSLENVGKAALIRQPLQDTVCGGFVFYLTPFLNDFDFSDYLYHYLISPSHKEYCRSSVKKSGQAFYNLSKASLNQALIPIPPTDEQRRIVDVVSNLPRITTNR